MARKRREGLPIPIAAIFPGAQSLWVDVGDLPEIFGELSPEDLDAVIAAARGEGDIEAARRLLVQAALQWAAKKAGE